MLAKKYRLAKQSDFKKIFQQGRKISNNFFNIRYLANSLGFCRFVVVASLKVSKKAVKRNKLKRQVRQIIGYNLSKFSDNFDIIINISPQVLNQDFELVEKKLLEIFKNIK